MKAKATDDLAYFRSLHYGYDDPDATICLWWIVWPDGRLHVRAERREQGKTIDQLATAIRRMTERLKLDPARYTAASQESIGKERGDGETTAETFQKNKIPLRVLNPDPLQGWTRVRELFGLRPDGQPWLTIHPSCVYLIKALTSAVQDKTDLRDVAAFPNDQPLRALRVGAMSRPAPKWPERPPLPLNAVGRLVDDLRRDATLARAW